MKKSIFEKLGLVEIEEVGQEGSDGMENMEGIQPPEEENTFVTTLEDVDMNEVLSIDSIYDKCGLADTSRSIFKIEEFKNILPDDIPNESKRKSVIGVITVSGLNLDSLLADSDTRIEALKAALETFTAETINSVSENDSEIIGLESRIDELKKKNIDRKRAQEAQESLIGVEIKKIEDIVKFIKPIQ